MFKSYKFELKLICVYVLFSCLSSLAVAQSIPQGWESYLDRPDILKISDEATGAKSLMEPGMKAAHFSMVAELFALYPVDTHFYFLARDSEHLYDVARLVTEGQPQADQIHLLNISRANMHDPHLKDYLAENGISEDTLLQDKKIVFIDTGFSGTIPRVIGSNFSEENRKKLVTHLAVSANKSHPSTRSFLVHLNPIVNDQDVGTMHGTIVNYEHIPRYTDRSSQLVKVQNKWHPISEITTNGDDGTVSKQKAKKFMQELKADWQKESVKKQFKQDFKNVKEILKLVQDGSESAVQDLKNRLADNKNTQQGRLFEAQVRDVFDTARNGFYSTKLNMAQLGLKIFLGKDGVNKNEFIEKYPEWAPILENPDLEIPKLFETKQWQKIGNLMDADLNDAEINKIIQQQLYAKPAVGILHNLQKLFIENTKSNEQIYLAEHIISQEHFKQMQDMLQLVIEKGDTKTKEYFARQIFSQEFSKDMNDLLQVLIVETDATQLGYLSIYAFTQEHMKDNDNLLKLLIAKADDNSLRVTAGYVFSKQYMTEKKELMRLLIQHAGESTLKVLKNEIKFVGPEAEIFKKAITIVDSIKRKQYLDGAFGHQEMPLKAEVKNTLNKVTEIKSISTELTQNDQIKIKTKIYTVLTKAGEGRRGLVYQVQDAQGKVYALKVAKDQSVETLKSLAQESAKAAQWKSLGLKHSAVLVQEKNYVLKQWIQGESGQDVIQKFASGDKQYEKAAKSVLNIVYQVIKKGAYVGDFRPANLIWDGKTWVIIDSGSIQQGLTYIEAHEKWKSADTQGVKFERRWKLEVPMCKSIFSQAG